MVYLKKGTMINIKADRLIIQLSKSDDAVAIYSYRSDFIENKYQGGAFGFGRRSTQLY